MRSWTLPLCAALLFACGETDPLPSPQTTSVARVCDPTNCGGCCRADGICMPGNALTICGAAGGACKSCSVQGACSALGQCAAPDDVAGADGGPTPDAGPGTRDDGCVAPPPILLASGYGVAVGDTTDPFDDATGSCGGLGGGDTSFEITTPSVGTLIVDVRPTSDSLKPVVYLRTACGVGLSQVGGGCAAAGTGGGAAQLVLQSLPAGAYFLWVDSAPGTSGGFNVTVNHFPSAGDACGTAIPLVFAGGEANAAGTTTGLISDGQGSCGGSSAADAVYSFVARDVVNMDATVVPGSANLKPVVYLRSACTGTDLTCGTAAAAGGNATLRAGSLAAGTYYLWVDSGNSTAGDFTLLAHMSAPLLGDACAVPRPLAFPLGPDGGTVTVTGDTAGLFGDTSGSCGGNAPDAVFSLVLEKQLNLSATVTTTSGTYQPVVYLRSGTCTSTFSESSCASASAAGQPVTLVANRLQPGNYFLFVDGLAATAGPFTLTAALAPPPQGDTCTSPKSLVLSRGGLGGTGSASGDTTNFYSDYSNSCGGSGPDEVYAFTTTTPLNLRASLAAENSSYRPVLALKGSSCTTSDLVCDYDTTGGTAIITRAGLAAGTYHLIVDGDYSTRGPYTLSATLNEPSPGDTCVSALGLTFPSDGGTVSVTGDTATDFPDLSGSCSGSVGPDRVYSFTTASAFAVRATVTTSSGTHRPVVYLRSTSCTGSERACNLASSAGGSATINSTIQPGTHWIFVDAYADGGPFTLTVTLNPPPPGDTCSSPIPLLFSNGQSGNATASGDTSLFSADLAACGSSGGARDVVYSFTTSTTSAFMATIEPSTFDGVLHLWQGSCTGSYYNCVDDPETINISSLPAGTWYLVVDGYSSGQGTYNLSATLTPYVAGETCTNPEPLTFTGSTASVTGSTSTYADDTFSPNCGGSGGDKVYRFTTSGTRNITATVTTTSTSYKPVVYLRKVCDSADVTQEVGCDAGADIDPATFTANAQPQGTYYLWLDGLNSTAGNYNLTVTAQ